MWGKRGAKVGSGRRQVECEERRGGRAGWEVDGGRCEARGGWWAAGGGMGGGR